CFEGIAHPGALSDHDDAEALRERLAGATFDTQVAELGLGSRAIHALDRANMLTVEDLMIVPLWRLQRARRVGDASRREIAEAVLAARGSVQDEPYRTQLATAVTRAAAEVERIMAEPRFMVRRDGVCVLIATSQELADYAFHLGQCADRLATEDPLAPPARVL